MERVTETISPRIVFEEYDTVQMFAERLQRTLYESDLDDLRECFRNARERHEYPTTKQVIKNIIHIIKKTEWKRL